jgi:hypothetical protein
VEKEISKEFEEKKLCGSSPEVLLICKKFIRKRQQIMQSFFATGTIGLSLTILDKFLVSNKCFYFTLIIRWLCLIASIIIQAISYLFHQRDSQLRLIR